MLDVAQMQYEGLELEIHGFLFQLETYTFTKW